MFHYDEEHRLYHFRNGELPPNLYSTLVFECRYSNEDDCIAKIISVMDLVTRYDRQSWPDDSYWSTSLPEWLLKTFKSYTPSELSNILSDRSNWEKLAWTFGSWLDRMRDRNWEWWSLDHKNEKLILHLSIDGYPYSTKALEHLIVAAGGRLLSVE